MAYRTLDRSFERGFESLGALDDEWLRVYARQEPETGQKIDAGATQENLDLAR